MHRFAPLFLVFATGFRPSVTFDIVRPAEIDLPTKIQRLAVIQRPWAYVGDNAYYDGAPPSMHAVQALQDALQDSIRFTLVDRRTAQEAYLSIGGNPFRRIDPDRTAELCSTTNASGIVALDSQQHFGRWYESWYEATETREVTETTSGGRSEEKTIEEEGKVYTAEYHATARLHWTVYDCDGSVHDTHSTVASRVLEGEGDSPGDARSAVGDTDGLERELFEAAGYAYFTHISPYDVTVVRKYFRSMNKDVIAGNRAIRAGRYKKAEAAWKRARDHQRNAIRGRALFNRAVLAEKQDNLDAAWKQARKARALLNNALSTDYVTTLRNRRAQAGAMSKQLVPPQEGVGMTFVKIAAGSFTMGCTPERDLDRANPEGRKGCYSDETPAHSVRLTKPFLLSTTEVTQGQWRSVMNTNPAHNRHCGPDCPVEKVSWSDAVMFANALSKKEGLRPAYRISGQSVTWDRSASGYRLPTEAEWEYAARAGEDTAYAGSNEVDRVAWYADNTNKTHRVAAKQKNAWGLYDMSGNVWEWCWDRYRSYSGSSTDPVGPDSGHDSRVARGGSCRDGGQSPVRIAPRRIGSPRFTSYDIGFRLARTIH
jgi:formylglycine-generating enzyme required for sulfatase activity